MPTGSNHDASAGPVAWKRTVLAELVAKVERVDPSKTPDAVFTYIEIGSIDSTTKTLVAPRTIRGADAPARARHRVVAGDVLVATVRPQLGSVALVPPIENGVATTAISVLRSGDSILPRYLYYIVQSEGFRFSLAKLERGATYPAVSSRDVMNQVVPVPPLSEQASIVSRLDGRLVQLDAEVDRLDQQSATIANEREETIRSAVTGVLTAAWRASRSAAAPHSIGGRTTPDDVNATQHDAATSASRESAGGAIGSTSDNVPYRTNEGRVLDLPDGWSWRTIHQIGEVVAGLAVGPSRHGDDSLTVAPYLRVANVQRGHLDLSHVRMIPASARELKSLSLIDGDILFAAGGDRDKLGRGWVWRNELEVCLFQNHIFRLRLKRPELRSEFISHFCNTFGTEWFESRAKQATNLASIGISAVRSMPIPIPPPDELALIDDRLRETLATIELQAQDVTDARDRLVRDRSSLIQETIWGVRVPAADRRVSTMSTEITRTDHHMHGTEHRTPESLSGSHHRLEDVLRGSDGWSDARDAFAQCGVTDGASTGLIERVYAELRALLVQDLVQVRPIVDERGLKVADELKLNRGPE